MLIASSTYGQRTSFADAKSGEYLAQQIVGAELASDRAERLLRKAQLLGEKLPASALTVRALEVLGRRRERAQMPLAREKHRLIARCPAGGGEDGAAQLGEAL